MKYLYSATTNSFYPIQLKEDYLKTRQWPEDGIEVDEATFEEFTGTPAEGTVRAPGADDMPSWVTTPPPTQAELVKVAEAEKQFRINQANAYMNSKQWPGKAAIGRLKGDELAQYNLWLDYLDALEAVDTSSAPAIEWPTPPVSAAE